jgi:HK97 family phage major capsid protein
MGALEDLANKNASVAHHFKGVLDEEIGPIRLDLKEIREKMSGETAQMIERIETELKETKAQLKTLQTVIQRPGFAGGSDGPEEKKRAGKSAFNKALRQGWGSLDTEEKKHIQLERGIAGLGGNEEKFGHGQTAEYKTMFGSDATTGGFLMTPEIAQELILAVVQISDFHSLVNVRMTANPWVILRKRTQTTSASRIAEQATRSETQNMKFGRVQVFPYTAYALSKISNEDLEDSELDLPGTIMADFAEEFARLEGYEIPNGLGQGANQCAGFLKDTDVTGTAYAGTGGTTGYLTSSATGGFGYSDLVDTRQALKPAYRKGASWAFTTETTGDLQKLTDSIGRPLLWDANGAPTNQLLGYPYAEMVDMPQVASGNFPVVFANWKKFFTLVVRKQVSIRVIDQRWIDEDATGYMGYYRFGGSVTLAEAGHALKIA